MTSPKNVAELQDKNVVFELECIDRMYLNLYVLPRGERTGGGSLFPRLQGPPVRFDQGGGGHELGVSPAGARLCRSERQPEYPL